MGRGLWVVLLSGVLCSLSCGARSRGSDQQGSAAGETAATSLRCNDNDDCKPACVTCGAAQLVCAMAFCTNGTCSTFGSPRCDCEEKSCGESCSLCASPNSLCQSGLCDTDGSCNTNTNTPPLCAR